MNSTDVGSARSVSEMFERVAELGPVVRDRSGEFEQMADLPGDVFDAIWESGVTRTCVPKEMGGLEGTPRDWFEATAALAEHDASVAWIVAQGNVQNAWLSVFAGTDFARAELARRGALPATSINGSARLERVDAAHFELTGHWNFLSGSSGATLIGGLAYVSRDEGPPEARFVVVPAERATLKRTWDNVGLRGTGSHEASVGPITVGIEQTWLFQVGAPQFEHAYQCFGRGTWPIAVSAAAVQIGLARRALDELAGVARTKPQMAVQAMTDAVLSTNPAIQREYARAHSYWLAARAGVREGLDAVWQAAQAGSFMPATGVPCQMAAAAAVRICVDIIRTAYSLAGTTAQRSGHPLQRCFRDGHVLPAHISVNDGTLEAMGRQLLA